MINLGSATIIKLIKHGERYHVLAQGQSGKIYHSIFSNEDEARHWINEHTHQPVKLEEV